MGKGIPSIGDPVMPIEGIYRLTVAFILAPRIEKGMQVNTPIGTGFFIHMDERIGNRYYLGKHVYLATAAHVVRKDQDHSLVRMNVRGPTQHHGKVGVEDIPIPEWHFHDDPGKDVAVAPVSVSPEDYVFKSVGTPGTERPKRDVISLGVGKTAQYGDVVYFMGLLGNVPEMGRANIPMVRSGTLGAMWQDGIPLRLPDGTSLRTTGHLVDCYSYAVFSGSPCFLYRHEMVKKIDRDFRRGHSDTEYWEKNEGHSFFGMIAGHFPLTEHVRPMDGGIEHGEFEVPVNAGVAVVVPAEFIAQVLMKDVLAEERERVRQELAESDPEDPAEADEGGA